MHQTTRITSQIQDFRAGRISREELLHLLTEQVRYVKPQESEFDRGDPRRWYDIEGGTDYTPGSFQEVDLAHTTGLLPRDLYNEIADKISTRAQGLSLPKL